MSKGETTRSFIISRAAEIFNQRGYSAGAISEIMSATGLKKGGIYRHFESKEQLAAEAFEYAVQTVSDMRFAKSLTVDNAVDKLIAFVDSFVGGKSPIPGGCPLMNTAIESTDSDTALKELSRKRLLSWHDRLEVIVKTGISKGEIREEVDAAQVVSVLISSLEGAVMIARLTKERDKMLNVTSFLGEYLTSLRR